MAVPDPVLGEAGCDAHSARVRGCARVSRHEAELRMSDGNLDFPVLCCDSEGLFYSSVRLFSAVRIAMEPGYRAEGRGGRSRDPEVMP